MPQSSGGIGYNISNAKNLVLEVKEGYKAMTEKIKNGWIPVSNALTTKWVSINSEKYEKVLAKHMADIHLTTGNVLNWLIGIFIESVNYYIDSETGVSLTQEGAEVVSDFDLTSYKLDPSDSNLRIDFSGDNTDLKTIVKSATRTFAEGTDFKIEDSSTASTLYNIINDYINEVKAQVTRSYGNLSSASAFPGDVQQSTIDGLISNVTAQLEQLSTFVEDLKVALEGMVGVITTAQENVSTAVQNANGVDSSTIF